ncbi:MAG: MFS transporter [Gemmatimonadaceae bacterium]
MTDHLTTVNRLLPLLVAAVLGGAVLFARKRVPAALVTLMITAFIDMVGLLMVLPLLPFYAKDLTGSGIVVPLGWGRGVTIGVGLVTALLVTAFTVAQLVSAPLWGRFSDRWGRRPALLVALGASAVAYVIFGFATSLALLFLSRLVQGAGGGTVGVIQAYVADATEPEQRARNLGWLSAATNLGVFLGPVLGAFSVSLGSGPGVTVFGERVALGHAAPGLIAALLCLVNMAFAWRFLRESNVGAAANRAAPSRRGASRAAVARVVTHPAEPAPRLIWIYAIAIGAQQGITTILALFLAERFGVTAKTIGYLFMYIGGWSVLSRALLLGKALDRLGEARLSRVGSALLALGLAAIPFTYSLPALAVAVTLVPLGTAFTFPCVTAMLSRVIAPKERGLYMGVQQTFGGISRGIFPIVLGLAWDHVAPGLTRGVPFWISSALVAFTIFLGMGMEGYVTAKKPAAVPAD